MIFEKKRNYEQDEVYFTWLDQYTQPRWNELLGANQTILQDFKDADKTQRIVFGRLNTKDYTSHVELGHDELHQVVFAKYCSLQNNIAVNYWANSEMNSKAMDRFLDALNRILLVNESGITE